jgi:hypothetical protein
MKTRQFVALLRGVNVGGNNIIRMADLKACLEKAGFAAVATVIQSGNVLLESGEHPCRLHQLCDPSRTCVHPAGPPGSERPPCRSWPLLGQPFCPAHDPARKGQLAPVEAAGVERARVREAVDDPPPAPASAPNGARPRPGDPLAAVRDFVRRASGGDLAYLLNLVAGEVRMRTGAARDR